MVPAAHSKPRRPAPLLVVAAVAFVAGIVCIIVAFVLGFSGTNPPSALHIGALGAPLGFAIGVGYALRSGRRSTRED